MSRTHTIVVGFAVTLSVSTLAQAQMANTSAGTEARNTPRAANTVRSGRTMPPSRDEAPSTTGSMNKPKREPGGLTIKGICIGCGAN